MKFSKFIQIVRPEYIYVRLTPNFSVRNNSTYKIARTINSLYKNILQSVKKEHAQVVRLLGREFLLGTKYSITLTPKVAYYIYMEQQRIEFYLIVPQQYFSVIKEKISDTWTNITVSKTDAKDVPQFSTQATKYQLYYAKENGISLAVDRRTNELLESNLNVVDVLEEGDKVGVFYNFIPSAQFGWPNSYQATMEKIRKNIPVDRNKVNLSYLLRMALSIVSDLIDDITGAFSGHRRLLNPDNPIASFYKLRKEVLK